MRSKSFLSLSFGLLFANIVFAQTHFGIIAGGGLSGQKINGQSSNPESYFSFQFKQKPSWQVGLALDGTFKRGGSLGFHSNLTLLNKGATYDQDPNIEWGVTQDTTWSQPLNQVSLQLLLSYKLWKQLTLRAGVENAYRVNKIATDSRIFLDRKSKYDCSVVGQLAWRFPHLEMGTQVARSMTPIGEDRNQITPTQTSLVYAIKDYYAHVYAIWYF